MIPTPPTATDASQAQDRQTIASELLLKTAFLDALIHSSIDGILVVDSTGRKILQNKRLIDLMKIPPHIADDPDDDQQIRWVTGMMKHPEQFVAKVIHLYAHPDEISRDEIELTDGTMLDRYSSPVSGLDGKSYGRIWTFRDITERKRAEATLRESQTRYRSLFENMVEGYAYFQMVRDEQGRACDFVYIDVNHAFEPLTGLKNVIGRKVSEVVPGILQTNPEVLATYERVVRTGTPERYQSHVEAMGIWFSISVYRVDHDQFVVIFDNITERIQAEAALAKSHRELVETSRLAGMTEVATGVLHNVGNVLNSVNVASSLLADRLRKSKSDSLAKVVDLLRQHEGDLPAFFSQHPQGRQLTGFLAQLAARLTAEREAALEELAQLQSNIGHIKEIVGMQQSLGKVSGSTETLSLAELVEDALKMNSNTLTRHHFTVIRDFQSVPPVLAERHKVLQILVNLLSNAKQAFDGLGEREKTLTLRIRTRDDRVSVEVADSGSGISPENLTRIFARGFTTKPTGHGFGLHHAALSAMEMGGSLTVRSDGAGHGAAFTLELPADPSPPID